MGRLGKVLELLYEAPRANRALHIRARQFFDLAVMRRVHESRNRAAGDSRSVLLSTARGSEPASDEQPHELWWASAGRWRHDTRETVTIADGGEVAMHSPTVGVVTLPDAAAFPPGWGLLEPRQIVAGFDIRLAGTVRSAGRRCYRLDLRPLANSSMIGMLRGPWLGDAVTCTVDATTGVVVDVDARFEGERCSSWTTEEFEAPRSLDAATFAVEPPDAASVRTMAEQFAEQLRLRGVDLTGVDIHDRNQVNEAVRQSHMGQLRRDPASLAAQHVAVGPPPDDAATAEAEVRDAFSRLLALSDDGAAVPAVEGGANLGPSLSEAGNRAPGGADGDPVTVRVDHVKFVSASEAVVWFSVVRGGHALLGTLEGRARRHDTRWLVSRATFAMIVGSVGVTCPPPPDRV